jgi:hypothetical protein
VFTSRNAGKSVAVVFSVVAAFALIFFGVVSMQAQVAGGTFTGRVMDASGAVVANAQVAAKNGATGVIATTTTNASGAYTLTNLLPASYEITVTATGFATLVQSGATLTVGAQQELNFSLQVGNVSQKIQVTAEVPAMQLTSSELSGTVESAAIIELPLNGRDWASLATLQPGVASVRTQAVVTQPGGHARGLGMQMTINGNRPTQNVYRLNGIIVNDYSNAGPGNVLGANLGVDAIQEFSVLTNSYSAQYGFTSGGVINAINRSGTNSFHGSIYEFLRNSALDASDFFANANGLAKPQFRRNQFGGSAGGPIKKDRIWIFGDYEGLRQSKGIPTTAHTPTQSARDGILSAGGTAVTLAACQLLNPNAIVPVPGQTNICVDSNTLAFINAFYPLPAPGAGDTGKYAFIGRQTVTENYGTERTDIHLSDHDTIDSSYYYDHSLWSKPDALNNQLQGFILPRWALSAEETHVFSPAIVNTVRFGYNTSGVENPSVTVLNQKMLDHTFGMTDQLIAPQISGVSAGGGVAGLTQFRSLQPSGSQNLAVHMYEVFDDAVVTVGNHNLKFGGNFLRNTVDSVLTGQVNGTVSFGNLAAMLENIPGKTQGPTVAPFVHGLTPHTMGAKIFGVYFQDDWKVRPGLTLNLGLRYEMQTIPSEAQGKIANLPLLTTNPGACVANANGTPNTAACSGFNFATFTSNPTKRNIDPRIGFAWDPFGDGKTAVRGGGGVFDVLPLPFMVALNNVQTSPFQPKVVFIPPAYTFPSGIGTQLLTLIAAGGGVPATNSTTWNYVEPAPKRNYVMQYNLNIQRQLTPSTSLTVAYAGSRGIHNPWQTDELNTVWPYPVPGSGGGYLFPTVMNTVVPVTNPVSQQVGCSGPFLPAGSCGTGVANPAGFVLGNVINPNVGSIQSTIWQSQSSYNSLQVEVEKRMSHGFQIQGSFTWGKTLDNSSGSFAGDNYASDLTPTIPWWNLRITKGPSDFNVGRNLVINGLWNIPTPASFSGPLVWLAKGWEVGGVFTVSDGAPLWPLDGIEGDPMGQLNSEPMAIPSLASGCTPKNLVQPKNVQYLKASCFINAQAPSQAFYDAPAPMGCDHTHAFPTCINLLGTLGRNVITGPGLINADASIVKDTHISRISENFNIQFRAEFFNLANHTNFAPPTNNLEAIDATGAPIDGFGQIDAQQVPSREIQFGLKVSW